MKAILFTTGVSVHREVLDTANTVFQGSLKERIVAWHLLSATLRGTWVAVEGLCEEGGKAARS